MYVFTDVQLVSVHCCLQIIANPERQSILLKFSENFHDRFNDSDYDVAFSISRSVSGMPTVSWALLEAVTWCVTTTCIPAVYSTVVFFTC